MKALSIRQPWAWLIANGYKPVENRTWPTAYRGPLLIHAGGMSSCKEDWEAAREICDILDIYLPDRLERGGVVGIVDLVDCVEDCDSEWFSGPYGFILQNARPVEFVKTRGQLGIFNLDIQPECLS